MWNVMPNAYFQRYRDCFAEVVSRSELDRLKDKCCEGCKFNKDKTCGITRCKFLDDYKEFREIIDAVRAPRIIYVKGENPVTKQINEYIEKTKKRGYKIKGRNQCKQIVLSQITKYRKRVEDKTIFDTMADLIKKGCFKRAKQKASKAGYDKIVETLNKFINGELGTINSKNK